MVQYLHGGEVYQGLTVWGDQLATYAVRECTRKRMYKLVLHVKDFPLLTSPEQIVETFLWAGTQLYLLSSAPGSSTTDRPLLDEIRGRWLSLSESATH